METVNIPIRAAKKVALDFGYDQVIIIGRKCGVGGREHCTTYGVDKEHCVAAAKAGDFLKYKVMGWAAAESQRVAGLHPTTKASTPPCEVCGDPSVRSRCEKCYQMLL
jgi:hypothetical protein